MKTRIGLVHFGFALTGIVTTMLGPILPLLAAHFNLNDAQAGRLFLIQFIASPAGALIASRVLSRWGASRTVPIGMGFIGVGVALIGLGTLPFTFSGIALYGLGLGFALPATNLLVVELVSARQAAALNILNFSWTLGAVLAPVAISAALKPIGLRGFLFLLGFVVLLIGAIEAAAFPRSRPASASTRDGKLAPSLRFAFAALTLAFLFLYVGIENGFSGWVPLFSQRSQHTSERLTAVMQSSFWAALLIGRLTAPLMLRFVRERALIVSGLTVAAAGVLLAIVSPNVAVLETGVLLSGFGMASVFPTAIAVFAEWYGTGGAGSIVIGLCGLGGAVVPWLVGMVSEIGGNLRIGLVVPLACIGAAALLHYVISTLLHEPKAQTQTVAIG